MLVVQLNYYVFFPNNYSYFGNIKSTLANRQHQRFFENLEDHTTYTGQHYVKKKRVVY